MMHCFQDSLTGASLNWYVQLEGSRIQSWSDLANVFIKQYQYNIDMAPDRTQLQNMSQKKSESFKVYAQRWRELAAQVRPPLLEAELVDIFTNTLQGAYFEKMVGSVSTGFSDMVKIVRINLQQKWLNKIITSPVGSQDHLTCKALKAEYPVATLKVEYPVVKLSKRSIRFFKSSQSGVSRFQNFQSEVESQSRVQNFQSEVENKCWVSKLSKRSGEPE
ncbi:unnamed protein product [Trifolium pratense]|uniref:Uncharacterized protein n=1 Tax=Trifolium pratense TaxID=57577 RepID=A0ACB0IZH7_TRIPR|nr:unnamed protein product [Trifolium pratense]